MIRRSLLRSNAGKSAVLILLVVLGVQVVNWATGGKA